MKVVSKKFPTIVIDNETIPNGSWYCQVNGAYIETQAGEQDAETVIIYLEGVLGRALANRARGVRPKGLGRLMLENLRLI